MVTSKPMGIKNVYFCTKDFIFFLYQNVKIVDVQMKSGFHIFILKKCSITVLADLNIICILYRKVFTCSAIQYCAKVLGTGVFFFFFLGISFVVDFYF